MKKQILLVMSFAFLVLSCSEKEEVDFDYVISNFKENAAKIQVVEYDDHRIDSSLAQNVFWNNKGTALLERNEEDDFFGFSFYGKRTDKEQEYLYDNENGFEILHSAESYMLEHPYSIIGSPGGQHTVKQIFNLDTIYKNVVLNEKENSYEITYSFEPDTVYGITDQTRVVELRKEDFFPVKVTYRSKRLGKKIMNQHTLSNVKINEEVATSIAAIKDKISTYSVIQEENNEDNINPVVSKKFPEIHLPLLTNKTQLFDLGLGKVTLLDFWEVWCGPCIQSFPKVEALHKKYPNLQVIGIATESEESALKLVHIKGVTFTNLFGSKKIHETYNVNSYPRYFLIDKEGIIRKEYHGFSEEIETDIENLLAE